MLTVERAGQIGRNALQRVLAEHTYAHRAQQVNSILQGTNVQPAQATSAFCPLPSAL
jgi:spore maturation protein CgeB